jgi:hypothetical protein
MVVKNNNCDSITGFISLCYWVVGCLPHRDVTRPPHSSLEGLVIRNCLKQRKYANSVMLTYMWLHFHATLNSDPLP